MKSIQVDVSSPYWLQTCKATEILKSGEQETGWSCVCLCVGERVSGTDWHSVGPPGIWISDQPLPPSASESVWPGMPLLRTSHPSTSTYSHPIPPPLISLRLQKATLIENTITIVSLFFPSINLSSSFCLNFPSLPSPGLFFSLHDLTFPIPPPFLLSTAWGTE